jgi:hypothetical protein
VGVAGGKGPLGWGAENAGQHRRLQRGEGRSTLPLQLFNHRCESLRDPFRLRWCLYQQSWSLEEEDLLRYGICALSLVPTFSRGICDFGTAGLVEPIHFRNKSFGPRDDMGVWTTIALMNDGV